jgi:hypothetical protein
MYWLSKGPTKIYMEGKISEAFLSSGQLWFPGHVRTREILDSIRPRVIRHVREWSRATSFSLSEGRVSWRYRCCAAVIEVKARPRKP